MKKSKSSLFLMELIIVIFFFALTSAVCMQVFVKAHFVAEKTKNTNLAILWADNAAECFYEYGGDFEKITEALDSSFDLSDYRYDASFREEGSYIYMDYAFYSNEATEPIYSFTFNQYIKEVAE